MMDSANFIYFYQWKEISISFTYFIKINTLNFYFFIYSINKILYFLKLKPLFFLLKTMFVTLF